MKFILVMWVIIGGAPANHTYHSGGQPVPYETWQVYGEFETKEKCDKAAKQLSYPRPNYEGIQTYLPKAIPHRCLEK